MKKKILLVVLILVVLLGAGCAYAYFATDIFKSNKEIFFYYISSNNMFENLSNDNLMEYIKKQENTSYSNKGEVSITAKGENDSEALDQASLEMLKNSKVTFEGKVDNSKKLADQTLTVDLSLGVNVPIKIKRDVDTFGIQSNLLDSKFIAIKNENLKALCKRFNIDAEEIPDKIEISKDQITKEDLKTLKDEYVKILDENLEDELFSKEKVNNETVITLKMTDKKFLDTMEKILEKMRNDEIILNKFSMGLNKEDIQKRIDDFISEIKETETNETDTVEIKLYTKSKEMKKVEISIVEDNTSMNAVLENNDNQLTMKIYEEDKIIGELDIEKQISGNDLIYTVKAFADSEEEGKAEINLKMQYKNLLTLDNVEESCEAKISYNEDTELGLNYTNLKTFSNDIEIEGLSENNAIIINSASDEELQNLLMKIYQNLGLLDDEQ